MHVLRSRNAPGSWQGRQCGGKVPAMMTDVGVETYEISATEADWTREAKRFWAWDPSRALLATIRDYQRASEHPGIGARIRQKVAVARHRFWAAVTGADIPINTLIGGGLLLPHPNGIVIHPDVRIGPNCLIFQQVTLGAHRGGIPTIGGHVDIGAGAKIVGPVTMGDHARIGMNAVVMIDVPAGGVAYGVPARLG